MNKFLKLFLLFLILTAASYFAYNLKDTQEPEANTLSDTRQFVSDAKENLIEKLSEQLKSAQDIFAMDLEEANFLIRSNIFDKSRMGEVERKSFELFLERGNKFELESYSDQIQKSDPFALDQALSIHTNYANLYMEIYLVIKNDKFLEQAQREINSTLEIMSKIGQKISLSTRAALISTFANAYQVFADDAYKDKANQMALYISQKLYMPNALHHDAANWPLLGFSHVMGEVPARLPDYVTVIKALLDLFEITQDQNWFDFAVRLQKIIDQNSWSEEFAYFLELGPAVQFEQEFNNYYETNLIHLNNLTRLYYLDFDQQIGTRMKALKLTFSKNQNPNSKTRYLSYLQELMFIDSPPLELALIEGSDSSDFDLFKKLIFSKFIPFKVFVACRSGQNCQEQGVALLKKKKPINDKTTLFICENNQCKLPINDLGKLNEFFG